MRDSRNEGADVTACDPDRLHRVGRKLAADTTAFDAADLARV